MILTWSCCTNWQCNLSLSPNFCRNVCIITRSSSYLACAVCVHVRIASGWHCSTAVFPQRKEYIGTQEMKVVRAMEARLRPMPQPKAARDDIDQPSVTYIPATKAPVCAHVCMHVFVCMCIYVCVCPCIVCGDGEGDKHQWVPIGYKEPWILYVALSPPHTRASSYTYRLWCEDYFQSLMKWICIPPFQLMTLHV